MNTYHALAGTVAPGGRQTVSVIAVHATNEREAVRQVCRENGWLTCKIRKSTDPVGADGLYAFRRYKANGREL